MTVVMLAAIFHVLAGSFRIQHVLVVYNKKNFTFSVFRRGRPGAPPPPVFSVLKQVKKPERCVTLAAPTRVPRAWLPIIPVVNGRQSEVWMLPALESCDEFPVCRRIIRTGASLANERKPYPSHPDHARAALAPEYAQPSQTCLHGGRGACDLIEVGGRLGGRGGIRIGGGVWCERTASEQASHSHCNPCC